MTPQATETKMVPLLDVLAAASLIGRINALPLAGAVSMKLARISAFLEEEVKLFGKVRDQKIKQYGKIAKGDSDPSILPEDTEAMAKFKKDMDEVADEKIEFPYKALQASAFKELTGAEINAFWFFMEGFEKEPGLDEADKAAEASRAKRKARLTSEEPAGE